VLPVGRPPIEGGWVTVEGERIVCVQRQRPDGERHDLGDVALLPGLVNAHTHLNFSDLAAPLGRPGMGLVDWLAEVTKYKLLTPSIKSAVEKGLHESARLGTTTLADISQNAPPTESLDLSDVGLVSFLELIAPTNDRVNKQLRRAEAYLAAADGATAWQAGLSPHAPYSVQSGLLARAVALSAERRVPLAMHLAESREEIELIRHRRGPFREFLEQLGVWEPDHFPDGLSVLDYLRTLAGAHRALIVHGNYLGDEEIAFLAAHADRMAVVYCPRTHAFFGHETYPLAAMLAAGVVVALGTDSRASSPDLSVLAEMREVHRRHPGVSPEAIVRLATLGGATALGMSHRLGTIVPGREADLTAVALPGGGGGKYSDPYRWLLESNGAVTAAWCRGQQNS